MPNAPSTAEATRYRRGLALALALALSLLAAPAWAQYKWKDSRGQVHVSDMPPPREIPDQDVLQRPTPAARPAQPAPAASTASAALPPKPPVDPELEARRKQAEQQAKAKSDAEAAKVAAQRAENCQRAREQLAALASGQRMMQIGPEGERVVLDDAARASRQAQAQQAIDVDCR